MSYPNMKAARPPLRTVLVALGSAAGVCFPEGLVELVADEAPRAALKVRASALAVVDGGALYLEVGKSASPVFIAPGQWASAAVKEEA